MEFKYWALLVALLLQNMLLAITVKLSKTIQPQYSSASVVFLNELTKFIVAFYAVTRFGDEEELPRDEKRHSPRIHLILQKLLTADWFQYMIPSVIYAIQNNIVFKALELLEPALYQVLANMKIVTTGLFSVALLSKSLHRLQWMALMLLAVGEALAESSSIESGTKDQQNYVVGTLLMLVFAMLSGLAGVVTEKLLKKRTVQTSFWMKSLMLYFWGAIVTGTVAILQDGVAIAERGFFYGYSIYTWAAMLLMSLGGLLVSLVITQFDNITKVYVTCVSVFLTSTVSSWLFPGTVHNINFYLSAIVVTISILIYNDPLTTTPLQ